MSDQHTDCQQFEDWLLEDGHQGDASPWRVHLESCANCREQWTAHQMLVATLAEEPVPELSPAFEAGLQRKLDAAVEVKPLAGWRLAAMAGYALLSALLMGWIFTKFPLPSIDTSSPWAMVGALIAVPLSLWLTAAATRLLPSQRPKGVRMLAL